MTEMYDVNMPEVMQDGRIVADDFYAIPAGHCRKCHKKIKPYPEKFYQLDGDSTFLIHREKSQRTSYCKSCAEKIAQRPTVMRLPRVIETYWQNRGTVEVKKFDNGITEESYQNKEAYKEERNG